MKMPIMAALGAAFLLAGCQEHKPPRMSTNVEDCRTAKTCPPIKPKIEARMYGMTGLLGRLLDFSSGVDTAMKAVAIDYPSVKTYPRRHIDKWAVLATAEANYKRDRLPIVLSGHSMGADAAVWIAHRLKEKGIPVAALFAYDPTPLVTCVPSNVQVAIGWRNTFAFQLGGGEIRWCEAPKKGERAMKRYDVPDFHTNIDDRKDVRDITVKHVGDIIHMIREMKQ